MKKFFLLLLSMVLSILFSLGVFAYAQESAAVNVKEPIEILENIGFYTVVKMEESQGIIEIWAKRFDGEDSHILIVQEQGNYVYYIESEGKQDKLIITPEGEKYFDSLEEENKVEVHIETIEHDPMQEMMETLKMLKIDQMTTAIRPMMGIGTAFWFTFNQL